MEGASQLIKKLRLCLYVYFTTKVIEVNVGHCIKSNKSVVLAN